VPSEETPAEKAAKKDEHKEPRVPTEPGLNRFVWDLRYPDARKLAGTAESGASSGDEGRLAGPRAAPGRYAARLTAGEHSATTEFEVHKDPRVPASDADLTAQFQLALALRDKVSEAHDAINSIRSIRQQVEEWERRTKESKAGKEGKEDKRSKESKEDAPSERISAAGKALKEHLKAIEEELTQVKASNRQDTLSNPVKLDLKLAALMGVVTSADAAPTRQARIVFDDLSSRLDEQLGTLRTLVQHEVRDFNALIRELDTPAIVPRASAED
jgi:hypothetical protein